MHMYIGVGEISRNKLHTPKSDRFIFTHPPTCPTATVKTWDTWTWENKKDCIILSEICGKCHSLLVCFNPEKLPQTSVLIFRNSFQGSFLLPSLGRRLPCLGPGPLPRWWPPHQGCLQHIPSHRQQKENCSPCSHHGSQGEAPPCPSRHGLASPLLQMGCYSKTLTSFLPMLTCL